MVPTSSGLDKSNADTKQALHGGRFSASRETYKSKLAGPHYSILGYPAPQLAEKANTDNMTCSSGSQEHERSLEALGALGLWGHDRLLAVTDGGAGRTISTCLLRPAPALQWPP